MTQAKVQISIGPISFSGEGAQDWLTEQLDKILERTEGVAVSMQAPLTSAVNENQVVSYAANTSDAAIATQSLASFLKEKGSTVVQNDKFLATSLWLHARGKNRLRTADVTRAIKEANQSRIGNVSDCLAQNIRKGFCEREGQDFFVTPQGRSSLGE